MIAATDPGPRPAFRPARRAAGMRPSAVREILKAAGAPGVISLAGGLPAAELFPADQLAAACAAVLADDGPAALQYGVTEGFPPLREWVCRHLADTVGLPCDPSQVLIASGSQQGLDLMAKVLLDPGDAVLVDDPAYLGALQAFRAYEADPIGVPGDDEGMRPDALRRALARAGGRAKLLYLCPNFHNPTGVTMSPRRREEVAAIAAEFHVPILEDDPYGRMRYEGADLPAVSTHVRDGGWAYLGTSSKTVAPGLRIAWLVVPDRELYARLVVAKQGTDLHTSSFAQRVLHHYVSTPGALDAHVARLRAAYGCRRDAMLAALARRLPPGWSWTRPAGGMFVWVTAPADVDAAALAKAAAARGVVFVPGEAFWAGHPQRNTLRLNFSNASEELIDEGVRRLAEVVAPAPATATAPPVPSR